MADTATPMRISTHKLEAFIASAFVAVGSSPSEAKSIAELMVRADAQGSEGHGVFRLPQYIRRIKGGAVNLKPKIRVTREAAGMALVDGDNGMGHLVMRYATEKAIEKAKAAGLAWVGVRMSNHAGPASLYASMPAQRDMIGLYLAVGNANHLPPWGGLDMLLSTNPIAVAVPAGDEPPVVLDMATTVAAYGKVKTKAQRGEMMPEGWMMDREGRPLTDPRRANEGFLLPIGGYKGYGLALVIGILAGTLNGAAMGKDVVDFNADDTSVTNTGHAIVAINIEAFQPVAEFKQEMDTLIRDLRGSRRLPGVDRIRLPGEGSHVARADRVKNGIPLPAPLLASLNELAGQLNIPPL
ncbi:MAG TPA: Ldh family oxidoreductase [Burkholderiales bacterium]|jgi:LDH2 family malate/lactate/ureidoglycolate dehydrogenase|nr:Ldh family oxidoreductase [Burkholderiales bacterium]